jgi:1,4-dihydroxy-2-naphthoate octaprenyltransferase
MRSAAAFVRLSRPKFLIGGLAGFALGAAMAAYHGSAIAPLRYAGGQAMVTAFHLMTHYANDYFDRAADRHGSVTAYSGGSGVLVSGALQPRTALLAALCCALAGTAAAFLFCMYGDIAAAVLGLAIGACSWAYSAPPARLAARGWGELDAVLVVGMLVPLAGFAVFAGGVTVPVMAGTLAPACAMFVLMIAVELPDRSADVAGGKCNLVVRFGADRAARIAAAVAPAVALALAAAAAAFGPWLLAAAALLLVPCIADLVRRLTRAGSRAVESAERGVALFVLTVLFELLAYVVATLRSLPQPS